MTPLKQAFSILRNAHSSARSFEQVCSGRCAEEGGAGTNGASSVLEEMELKSESQITSQCHVLTQYIQKLRGFTNRKKKVLVAIQTCIVTLTLPQVLSN